MIQFGLFFFLILKMLILLTAFGTFCVKNIVLITFLFHFSFYMSSYSKIAVSDMVLNALKVTVLRKVFEHAPVNTFLHNC